MAAIVAGVSVAALRLGTLPRWMAVLGFVVLAVFVVNAAWWQMGSLAALGLFWNPLLSVLLVVRDTQR